MRPRFVTFDAVTGPPLGAILGSIGLGAAVVVRLLGPPERIALPFCAFKLLSGWPCPTCGATRALYCLSHFDLAGALAMNPLATLFAAVVGLWALADVVLLARRRSLRVGTSPALAPFFRGAAVALIAANWLYLVAAGR